MLPKQPSAAQLGAGEQCPALQQLGLKSEGLSLSWYKSSYFFLPLTLQLLLDEWPSPVPQVLSQVVSTPKRNSFSPTGTTVAKLLNTAARESTITEGQLRSTTNKLWK